MQQGLLQLVLGGLMYVRCLAISDLKWLKLLFVSVQIILVSLIFLNQVKCSRDWRKSRPWLVLCCLLVFLFLCKCVVVSTSHSLNDLGQYLAKLSQNTLKKKRTFFIIPSPTLATFTYNLSFWFYSDQYNT